jgi:hypothetical protein
LFSGILKSYRAITTKLNLIKVGLVRNYDRN